MDPAARIIRSNEELGRRSRPPLSEKLAPMTSRRLCWRPVSLVVSFRYHCRRRCLTREFRHSMSISPPPFVLSRALFVGCLFRQLFPSSTCSGLTVEQAVQCSSVWPLPFHVYKWHTYPAQKAGCLPGSLPVSRSIIGRFDFDSDALFFLFFAPLHNRSPVHAATVETGAGLANAARET